MKPIIFFIGGLLLGIVVLWLYRKETFLKQNAITFPQPFNDAYRIFNVANCMYRDRMLLAFRLSTLTRCSKALDTNPEKTKVKNYLLLAETNPLSPEISTYQKLFLPHDISSLIGASRYSSLIRKNRDLHWGVEDIRIVYDDSADTLLAIGNLPVVHDYTQNIMYLALLKKEGKEWKIQHETLLHPTFDSPYKIQKNWIPILKDNILYFVYSIDPFVIVRTNTMTGECDMVRTIDVKYPFQRKENQFLRGSTQAVPYNGGYLALAHVTTEVGHTKKYHHFFVHIDSSLRNVQISNKVCFGRCAPIQFAMGLSIIGENAYITYGENDCDAKLTKMSLKEIKSLFA